MGGGGSEGPTDNTVRFAPYLENAHGELLNDNGSDTADLSLIDALNAAFGGSPFGSAPTLNPDDAFFGSGYSVTSFPSLYDMFGRFMAGLDLHVLWEQTYNGIITSAPLGTLIASHAERLDDDVEQRVIPRFEAGMRNIGAIHSTAFAMGRALIEETRIREFNNFVAKLELGAFETSIRMWQAHLDWNKNVTVIYSEMIRLYYGTRQGASEHNAAMDAKHVTFDLDLFEYARAMLGALSGSPAAVGPGDKGKSSPLASGIAGGVAGAAAGSSFGPWGAAIGGVIGFAAGFFS